MAKAQFEPVQPVRAYERIVEQIEEALARGDLSPGQRLPSERELVTPVRGQPVDRPRGLEGAGEQRRGEVAAG